MLGVPAMNTVAKRLAEGLNIYINTRITSLEHKNRWEISEESGQIL